MTVYPWLVLAMRSSLPTLGCLQLQQKRVRYQLCRFRVEMADTEYSTARTVVNVGSDVSYRLAALCRSVYRFHRGNPRCPRRSVDRSQALQW